METKDWIIIFIPILSNGIILFIFQKIIISKLEHLKKKNDLRDEVILLFWKKLQTLNDIFIQTNISLEKNPDSINTEINKIYDAILSIIQYYDTNKYDLKIFSVQYKKWENSWNIFSDTLSRFSNLTLTHQMVLELGQKLQYVKTCTLELINATRKKY